MQFMWARSERLGGDRMPRTAIGIFLCVIVSVQALPVSAVPVFDHSVFPDSAILNYSDSPAGPIAPGDPVINQYASLGVRHDGHTTTPPGPSDMSSFSGLPGLEAGSGDVPGRFLEITFGIPVTGVGAFYLMGASTDPITLSVFDAENDLIETIVVLPGEMPMRPGPSGFNEGFVGILTDTTIALARFDAETLAFVIDDLHVVPEPATGTLAVLGALAFLFRRNRRIR